MIQSPYIGEHLQTVYVIWNFKTRTVHGIWDNEKDAKLHVENHLSGPFMVYPRVVWSNKRHEPDEGYSEELWASILEEADREHDGSEDYYTELNAEKGISGDGI
jgi:hypothetical protein